MSAFLLKFFPIGLGFWQNNNYVIDILAVCKNERPKEKYWHNLKLTRANKLHCI